MIAAIKRIAGNKRQAMPKPARRPGAGGAKPVLTAAALLLATGAGAGAQTGSEPAYTAMIEGLCRSYAGAQVGQPPALAFTQCMALRHCRVTAGAPGYFCEMPGPLAWHGGGY